MRRIRSRLNHTQRLMVSISIAAALFGANQALVTQFRRGEGGWFGYAPNTSVTFSAGNAFSRSPWLQLLLWIALVVVWVTPALWLFADDKSNS